MSKVYGFFFSFFCTQVIETYIRQYLVNVSLPYLESSCDSVKLTERKNNCILHADDFIHLFLSEQCKMTPKLKSFGSLCDK